MVTINVCTHIPSGNINTVTLKINLYAQWLSEYAFNRDTYATTSGNIITVPEIINPSAQWLSQYMSPVAILTQSLKYTLIHPVAVSILLKSRNTYTQWLY